VTSSSEMRSVSRVRAYLRYAQGATRAIYPYKEAPTPYTSEAASAVGSTTAAQLATQQQTQSANRPGRPIAGVRYRPQTRVERYGDPDTMGRDSTKPTSFFREIHEL